MREKLKTKIILILMLITVGFSNLSAQDEIDPTLALIAKKPIGTEFWLCFMTNFKEEPGNVKNALLLELFITGDHDATVSITIPSINYNQTMFVPAGTVRSIVVDPLAQIRSYEVVERGLGVNVMSDQPISVYGLNRRHQTTDTYLGLPVNVLGTEYRVMCYHVAEKLSPIFAIVATENNTIVEISPSTITYTGKPRNEKYTITLNKGDAYQVGAETESRILRKFNIRDIEVDLTGSLIKSNKKIAVFSGHECTYIPVGPPRIKACNHLVEQIPPVNSWGKHFYIGRLKGRSFYTYRVLAHEPNTKVFENSKLIATLKPGQFIEKNSNQDLQVTADKPVLVSQYSQGYENGDQIGDPMMLLISPTQQFLNEYRFATPINGSWNHHINVVVPTNAIETMELNDRKMDVSDFTQLGLTRYSIAFIDVPFGTHYIRGNQPFGMYSYGFGFGDIDAYDAYGNMGGQSFLEYVPKKDTIPPMAVMTEVDGNVVIIVRDDRVDDLGLSKISVVDSAGISATIPRIADGMPQAQFSVKVENPTYEGSLVLELMDVGQNISLYTLCYSYEPSTGGMGYSLIEGISKTCISNPGYTIGVFGQYSLSTHSANFDRTGDLSFPGKFSSAAGSGGWFGIYASTRLLPKMNIAATLALESIGGELNAPDSILSSRRDPESGQLLPFQESHLINLDNLYANLSIGVEYFINRLMYLNGGINFGMALSKSVEIRKRINIPDNYIYENGSQYLPLNVDELESLNSFRLGFYVGIGASVPIYDRFSGFFESSMNFSPFDMAEDTDWQVQMLKIRLGAKYLVK